jgi:exonuclease SbcC
LLAEADRGSLLLERLAEARSIAAGQTRDDSIRERIASDLAEVADLIGVDVDDALDLEQTLSILSSQVDVRLRSAQHKADSLASLAHLVVRLADATERDEAAVESMREAFESKVEVDAQLREVERRKEVASALRKDLERVRAGVIGDVFSGRLNESWASVFRALVPTEPFTPQFKVPREGVRVASVELETVDRAGVVAGSPAAMLSQGNLNTAALALFVGLHFSSQDAMPWLLFDDPVQSMDDLHVANFASLVKQLTRQHGRQVVLAVHQRELFEYLKLELTPAAADQSLVAVSLDRSHGVTDVAIERIVYEPDDALVGDAVA